MATNNAVNVSLAGQTGTGTFVGAASPTLVTPVLGAASATSLTFSSTSGIIGTTTNNNAAAGSVGEYIASHILNSSAISLTDNIPANVTSISLTAGDWDVYGNVFFTVGGNSTVFECWTNTVSATSPDPSLLTEYADGNGFGAISGQGLAVPTQRYSLAASTTVYLTAFARFSTSTVTASGLIYARRVR